jgi:hypothetical protein
VIGYGFPPRFLIVIAGKSAKRVFAPTRQSISIRSMMDARII